MKGINTHDTTVRANDRWYVARASAADALAATRRDEVVKLVFSSLIGAAFGVYAVTRLSSAALLSVSGVLLVVACIGGAVILGAILAYAPRQGEEPRGPRGTIPGAILTDRAAQQLTPEGRDRLVHAYDEGVLNDALTVVEKAAREDDTRTARQIMDGTWGSA